MSETEGARYWLNVLTDLQNRGVKDTLIACVDGLKVSLRRLKPPIRTQKYNSASFIKSATA
ncbi:hypothetical protein HJ202_21095 [Vibrio parahaemolyticus]|nr:hypothetical protein [Vibrio parahaemolyticus]EHH2464923.1 hypothetical protein [Vibrio parahaemolyticus]EIA1496565.1 transposase [Vibrio parahaemolyticus]ELA7322421.1 transposase [Vibrio parahaemolyticus]MBE3695511.1 hypothetical protein [Vibrio parahaemolyticus]